MKKKFLIRLLTVTLVVIITAMAFSSCAKVKKIEITNDGVKYHESIGKYAVVYFDEDGKASYQIEYKVSPKRNEDKVKFEYKETEGVSVSEDGLVTFTSAPFAEGEASSIRVAIVSDGKGDARDEILIIARYKN